MFKNLKSLFVVTDEAPENSSIAPNSSSSASTTTTNIATGIDENILHKLLDAFEKNNQAGFDYFEFRQSLKAMNHLPLDESTKFQTAFATATAVGVTQDILLKSIDFYAKVLQNEKDIFSKASHEQIKKSIDSKKVELKQQQDSVQEKSNLIQKLTIEIMEHQKKTDELTAQIKESENKINETQTKFNTTVSYLEKQLTGDATKIKTYIK